MLFSKSKPAAAARRSRAHRRAARPAAQHREGLPARPDHDLRAAPRLARHQGRRVRVDHGPVGRRQVVAAPHPRHARHRLDRRVLVQRRADPRARQEGARRGQQEAHRLRVPELPPARQPDGLREPGRPALLPQHPQAGARQHRLRHPRSVLRSSGRRTSTRTSSRAASSSWSRWRARSSPDRR